MKVVLFCGGQGIRLREYDAQVPKPMVRVGTRPILWHIMKYYAHFGFRDFVICLGHQGHVIKEFFLNYQETISNDFVLRNGGRTVELASSDLDNWRITFVDTGLHANIGQRLRAVEAHVRGGGTFLANYGDCLTDARLDLVVEEFDQRDVTASFLSVRPSYPIQIIRSGPDGVVESLKAISETGLRMNGGYFVLRDSIFDEIRDGEELVVEPFRRLAARQQLLAYTYDGFWAPMDTLRERQRLESLAEGGDPPWAVWLREPTLPVRPSV